MIRHPRKIPLEYNRVTNYIVVGTNACCQQHFDSALLKKRIRADISLEDKHLDQPWGISYFLWLPTKNHKAPKQEQLTVGVAVLKALVRKKIRTYVHCQRGHGRAPTLVAAYLLSQGKSFPEALKFLKKKRPTIHLEKVQMKALKQFERNLRRLNHD